VIKPKQLPTTLLAAVDYSDLSQLVVENAVDLARRHEAAEAHFLHVTSGPPGDMAASMQHGAELLEWLGYRLKAIDGIPPMVRLIAHVASGDPATLIVQTAADLFADVVVIGTHGRTGVQRLVWGSVAESVVRRADCPVLVVRPKTHEQTHAQIEPACPRCVQTRIESGGAELWCDQHGERHGRRHTYFDDRAPTWVNQRLIL
jgi:nucleotide-binding universal stress UspA family protein